MSSVLQCFACSQTQSFGLHLHQNDGGLFSVNELIQDYIFRQSAQDK